MRNACNERESSNSRDMSVDDLKRSCSPLGPHRSKLVIICLTCSTLARLMVEWVKGNQGKEVGKESNIYYDAGTLPGSPGTTP